MKPKSPLTTLPKTRQRRQLTRDVRRYQKAGGRIQQLDTGTARGPVSGQPGRYSRTVRLLP